LSSIEINGTFYSTFKRETWRKWRDETPDDFVFAIKASRYCTNRKILADAGPAVARFLAQGLSELGRKLGPINWQFAATKRFDADDFAAFLALLPREQDGIRLRHALEVSHPSFAARQFHVLAREHGAAIVHTDEAALELEAPTMDFTYARLRSSEEQLAQGLTARDLRRVAKQARAWANDGDVFVYFIAGAKVRNPAAAQSLMREIEKA
jgi:uncharacterized protein YecE (DUF72 family)